MSIDRCDRVIELVQALLKDDLRAPRYVLGQLEQKWKAEDEQSYNEWLARKGLADLVASELERAAAALWRKENPDKSVFDCAEAEKQSYRKRALKGERA